MEDDILNYLPTVMFRGTPCITILNQRIIYKDDIEFVFPFPCLLGHPVHLTSL